MSYRLFFVTLAFAFSLAAFIFDECDSRTATASSWLPEHVPFSIAAQIVFPLLVYVYWKLFNRMPSAALLDEPTCAVVECSNGNGQVSNGGGSDDDDNVSTSLANGSVTFDEIKVY